MITAQFSIAPHSVKHLGQPNAESGKHILAAQRFIRRQRRLRSVCAVHARDSALRIHNPHESCTGINPVTDFREHSPGAIG